jgi:hypothetical protein
MTFDDIVDFSPANGKENPRRVVIAITAPEALADAVCGQPVFKAAELRF